MDCRVGIEVERRVCDKFGSFSQILEICLEGPSYVWNTLTNGRGGPHGAWEDFGLHGTCRSGSNPGHSWPCPWLACHGLAETNF